MGPLVPFAWGAENPSTLGWYIIKSLQIIKRRTKILEPYNSRSLKEFEKGKEAIHGVQLPQNQSLRL